MDTTTSVATTGRADPADTGVAARTDIVPRITMRSEIERIGSQLDSIEHATFNAASPPPGRPGDVNCSVCVA